MSRRSLLWLLTPVLALGQGSQLPKYTVATLPAASAQPSYTVQVIDGANDQDCVTGGGTKNVLCKSNGTAWVPVSPFQSLTTTGTSGPATLNLGVLNVPNYNGNSTSFRHNGTALTGAFAGSPQIYDYDETTPAADGGFTNATGRFDTVTGKWNVEVPNSLGTQLRMNPGEDATHVFVPFGTCVFTTNNSSLTATGSGCDALGGYFASYKGGLFNHNVSAQMDWSNPVLPAWLPAGNVTGVQIVSYSSGQGTASGTCGGSGSCATNWLYPPFTTQKATTVTGVTGATFSSLTARASQSQSVYCTSCADPFTITGSFTVSQIGLLVQFSGVTNPSPSTALNVDPPIFYRHSDNSIGISDTYPFTIAPILTSLLTTPAVPNGSVVWTSDNTTAAVGDICTGSGTAGSDYALCISGQGGYTLLADFGGPGFGVLDINSSDGSLTISPTIGHVDAIINPAHHNTWTTQQTFNNSRLELLGLNSPINARSGDGASGNCLISLGAGNTPIWQACPGTVGPGTAGYIPAFATTTTVGNSHIDDGVTTASTITSTEPIAIAVAGTQGGTADLTEGTAPSAAAGHDILYADSTAHCIEQSLNGGSFACLGTGGSGPTLQTNGTPNGSQTLLNLAQGSNVTLTDNGTGTVTIAASGGGGGGAYTNVPGSSTETTVAALNTTCGSGTLYATTALSIATGGTLTCPVQFSKGGVWTVASGQTVTFAKPITTTDAAPQQHFAGSGSVVLAAQDAPAEWFGAVGDGVYSAGTGTDNATAFQTAINSISVGNMLLQCATYKSASVVNIHARNNVGIKGCQTNSKGNTTGTVVFTTSASATIFDFAGTGVTTGTYMYHNYISDLDLKRTIQPTGTATNLSLSFMCGAFVNRVFSEDAVRGFYLKGFGNCGVGEINDSNAQYGAGNFTPNNTVSYYGFYLDSTGGVPFASTVLTRPGVGVVASTGTVYGVYITGSLISDVMVKGLQTSTVSYGVYIDGSGSGSGGFHQSDLHFKDSILDNSSVAGIFVTSLLGAATGSVEFGGGWVETAGGNYAIDIENSLGVSIHDMQIAPNGGATLAAIRIHSSDQNILANNYVTMGWNTFHNGGSSLIVDNSNNFTITGNVLEINPSVAGTNVVFTGTSTYGAFSGNTLIGGSLSNIGVSAGASTSHISYLNTNAIGAYTTQISDSGTANQLTSGTTTNALTMNNSGSGATSGSTFDGSAAKTISYNTIGAAPTASPTFTGTPDASGATAIKLPVSAGCTATAQGNICYDSTNKNWHLWVNGVDKMLIPLAAGFVSGNCGQPTLSGTSWEIQDAGGACGVSGGGAAFSAITTGTNSTATMTVGTGGSIVRSGTGHIDADKIGGIAVSGTPATGNVLTATSTSAATWSATTASGSLVLLGTYAATAATSLQMFTRNATGQSGNLFQSDYDDYIFKIKNLNLAASSREIYFRASSNGTSCDATTATYSWGTYRTGSGASTAGSGATGSNANSTATTGFILTTNLGDFDSTTQRGGLSGTVETWNPLSTTIDKTFNSDVQVASTSAGYTSLRIMAGGKYLPATPVALVGACIEPSTGNFVAASGTLGTVSVYGVAH
jgi:hypothetical protein